MKDICTKSNPRTLKKEELDTLLKNIIS
jgi:alcohol dehydrogenase class IV